MRKLPWKRLLSLLLTLTLMVQLLPLDVFATEISETTTTEERPTSTAVEVSEAISPTVVGEVEELRTEDSKQFRMSDGSYMAVSYGMPVHFQGAAGEWTDIDNTLENIAASDGTAALVSTNGSASASFAGNLSSGQVFSAAYGTQNISLSMLDVSTAQQLVAEHGSTTGAETVSLLSDASSDLATFSRTATATVVPADTTVSAGTEEQTAMMAAIYPETLESAVLYEDVYSGVDLLYNLTGYNIKESIIVNEPLDSYYFTFLLELDGLTPQMQEDGSINLLDENDEVIWFIPAPYMFDAENNASSTVEYTLTDLGTAGALLTVEADATWINSAERTFPVTIDPTLYCVAGNALGEIYATHVEQGNDTSHGHYQKLFLGYTAYQSLGERWIYLHFNQLPEIPQGSVVVNAALNLWQLDYSHGNCPELPVGAYEVTSDKASDETYHDWIYYMKWSDKATYDSSNMIDYATASEATDDGYLSWDLTELFNKWYDTGTENRTLALVPTDTGKFSSSYYGIPVFYAYGQNHPPVLMVSYRNNTGIEPYYTYQTMGAGHAGTAYISDYSGQLTVAKELFSLASTVNPFSIQMVYNSAYFSQTTDSQYDLCADLGMEMHVGSGWTYNFLQHVKEETIDGVPYIRYLDGDGTIHYFAEDSSKEEGYFYDEDGLGLKINEYYDNYYSMTDDHGNEWVFVRGHLLWIKDSNGNRIQIEYSQNGTETTSHYPPSTGARIERIYQQNVGQSRVDIATFHYASHQLLENKTVANYLTSIEDGAGNTYSFTYNNGKLTSIAYNNQEIAHYSMWVSNGFYQNQMDAMTDVEAGYSLNFSYTNHRVSAVEETADITVSGGDLSTGEDGVRIEIGRTDDGWTVYTDPGADRTTGTSDDLHTYYGFDYFGRTVNGYTTDASDNIIGASNAVYSGTGSTDRTNNRTMRTASIGVAAQQELQNFGFESVDGWSRRSSGGASSALATTLPRTGARSLRFTIPDSSTDAYSYAYKSSNTLQADTTYILSAYVNTSQATAFNGDGLYLKVQDTAGNVWTSDCLNYQTSALVDDGWVRISLAFTAEVQGAHTVTIYNDTICGNVFVDDLQLEKTIGFVTGTDEETGATQTSASAISNVNLLENGNMQGTNGWTMNAGSAYVTGCGVQSTATSARSVKVTGNPTADNYASQVVTVKQPSDQTYVLSGWAMANAVPDNVMDGDPETDKDAAGKDTNKQFGLRAVLTYADNSKEYHYVPFNPDLSGWQFTSLTIVPRRQKEKESDPDIIVTSIEVQCAYEKNGNAAWFDNLSLVREAAQTMKYDDKGNLVSVTTTGIKEDADTYEGGNLIKTVTGGNGTYEYKYDDADHPHRLTSVVNTLVSQEMTYNTTGNVTKTTLFATENEANQDKPAYGKTLESSSEYDSEGASGNLMSSTTDTSGQTVTYDYEGTTNRFYGRTTEIIDAAGTTTTMGYDQFGRVLEKELWEKDAVANTVGLRYTYTKGILSQVRRQDASGNTQTYGYDHDSFGNLTEITVGDIVLAEYIYGPQNGYLLEQSYGNGDNIAFAYDNLGRTTKATYSSGRELSYTYTGDGQVHAITDNNGTTDAADDLVYSYTYDTLGRTVDSQMCRGIQVLLKTHWEYDDANRIQSQSWQVGTTGYKEVYTYDEDDGSLVKITVEGDIQDANLVYDALRRLHQVTTDTYTKTYSYRDISNTRTTTQITGLSYTGLFNHTFGYTYNALGYISAYSPKAGETIQYDYDAQGQLTSVTQDGVTTTYTYDSVGNIQEVKQGSTPIGSYEYSNNSWRDLLTKYNGGAIAYEGQTYNAETNTATGDPISGNPISYFNGNRWNFTWQNGRQLATTNMENDTTEVDVAYTYDFDGLRTGKTVVTRNYEYIPAHNYVDTVINPTCTEVGYTLHQCACGYSYEDSLVPALGHDYVQSGETYTCSRCGDSYSDHIHSYTATVIAPTCTEQGYTIHSCACGHSYQSNITEALGHDYEESNTTGGIVYTCTRCGDSYSEHTHTYSSRTVAATCTTGGYILHTCTCGYSYQSNATEPLGHDYHADNTDVGTVYTCSRCGDSYMDHTHSYTDTVVEPTCTEQGYTLQSCDCGYSYQDTQTDALGHNYVGSNTQVGTIYTCTRCDDSYTGHTHVYTETVVAATCTTDGYTLHSCACGYDYQSDIVAALGHNYQESTEGSDTVYTCTRCGDSYSGHTHSYTETVVEPTCTEQGYTLYECSCGHSYEDDVVDALGHDWVVAEETETMLVRYCARCFVTVTEEIITPIDPEEPPVEYSLRSASVPSEDCGATERTLVSTTTENHEYVYASGTLLRETITTTDEEGNVATETLDFVYDLNGSPYALNYTSGAYATQTYYYITNVQGDVTHLVTTDGTVVAEYGYDAWGKVTAATGTMAEVNPLLYRGYYCDAESGFYYLQSRYYDPVTCRFINADSYVSTGQDFLGHNMFAYCGNNPVIGYDPTGEFGLIAAIITTGAIVGGLMGAFSAATTGGNILESTIEGCLTGALGSACGLLISNPVTAVVLATVGGATIDVATQATVQYVETGEVNIEEVDVGRAIKTGVMTGMGTAIPQIGNAAEDVIDAFGTALVWAEGSAIITVVDVVVTKIVEAVKTPSRTAMSY